MASTNVGGSIGRAGAGAAHDVAPWIVRMARVGYAAKAVLYGTIGVLAARVALGEGGETTDSRGALRTVLEAPFGRTLLFLMAAGLVSYALWRVVQAITDPERRGSDAKGIALRSSFAARGLLHLGVAFTAFRMAMRNGEESSGGDTGAAGGAGGAGGTGGTGGAGGAAGGGGQEEMAARTLEAPGGETLLWLVGAAVLGYGLYQLYRAYAAKLSKQLDLGQLSAETGRWAIGMSRFGIAARGVVFCLTGFFVVRAAMAHDPNQAGGVDRSLDALGQMGTWPLAVVAIGLVAYGAYEMLNARYRLITVAG